MNTTPAHEAAERRFRRLLQAAGLPQPDESGCFRRAVVFLFHASRAVVVVALDEFDSDDDGPWTRNELDDLASIVDAGHPPEPEYLEAA